MTLTLPTDAVARRADQTLERRSFSDLSLRAVDDDGDGVVTFDGIASVVDTPYEVHDAFGKFQETIVRGSFNKTLKERDDVRLLVNHTGVPIARTKSKTLALTAEPDLRSVAKLDATNPTVQELRSAMARGDLDQMSIGFRVTKQEWNEDYTDRVIREVQLIDVSVVTFPASPTTSAAMRSLEEAVREFTADVDNLDEDQIQRAVAFLQSLLKSSDDRGEQVMEQEVALALESARRAWLADHDIIA